MCQVSKKIEQPKCIFQILNFHPPKMYSGHDWLLQGQRAGMECLSRLFPAMMGLFDFWLLAWLWPALA
jgi:hypothetical protein